MKLYLRTKDYFKTKEEFDLLYDEDLNLLKTSPQPENLDSYYDSEEYISHTDTRKDFVSRIYQLVKSRNLSRKLSLINRYSSKQRNLLDIGAGTGDFLVSARKNGWQVSGVEPNQKARSLALEKGQHLEESVKNLKGSDYNVITLWHVLEHLPDLNAQIEEFSQLISKNGLLVIAVPNFKSFDARYYREFWAAYDVPRHLWHFSKKSIPALFTNSGFELVATKPMIFDAFYVSMLSEKYKQKKLSLVRGIAIGFLSNIKALFSGEYSSLIYILRKEKD
ncbi:class I SAM-dependent methyltransferase [Croceivirga thetidis]|uniref:Class I SAM-dependent methyltransferase n=1 Tax=Croceivirga thetidis TaxID=2721623 RepID=A0ABX1GNS5_9FLAO|nr:class I SAM-dependent methyltransferase [Croceivirga thetidis]NKI31219.1 class I SAM-dependent methyltransferase [Croceivirga thetidis]